MPDKVSCGNKKGGRYFAGYYKNRGTCRSLCMIVPK